mgnify:CR=1 FL=1
MANTLHGSDGRRQWQLVTGGQLHGMTAIDLSNIYKVMWDSGYALRLAHCVRVEKWKLAR